MRISRIAIFCCLAAALLLPHSRALHAEATASASQSADRPTSRPTSQSADALPVGAVRLFGSVRFDPGRTERIALSPDGRRLATVSADAVTLWDTHTSQMTWRLRLPDNQRPYTGEFLVGGGDELAVVMGSATRVAIHATSTGQMLRTFVPDQLDTRSQLAVTRDGNRLALGGQTLQLFDAQSTEIVADLGEFVPERIPPRLEPAGRRLVPPATAPVRLVGNRLQFTADGITLVVVDPNGKTRSYDARTGQPSTAPSFFAPGGIALSDSGRYLATFDERLHLFDAIAGDELPAPPVTLPPRVAAPATTQPVARLLRPPLLPLSATRWLTQRPRAIAFLPGSDQLAVFNAHPQPHIDIWDATLRPYPPPLHIETQMATISMMQCSRDRRLLALLYPQGSVELIDLPSGKPRFAPDPHEAAVFAANLSPDGRFLFTGDSNNVVNRWDVASGALLASARPEVLEYGGVNAIRYVKDHVLVASDSRAVRLLDPNTLATTFEVRLPVIGNRPTFSSDGRLAAWIAGGAPGNVLYVWNLQDDSERFVDNQSKTTAASFLPGSSTLLVTDGVSFRTLDLSGASGGEYGPPAQPGGAPGNPPTMVFSPDGSRMLFSDFLHAMLVDVGSLASGAPPLWTMRMTLVAPPSFSPNGQLLFLPINGNAQIAEALSGRPIVELPRGIGSPAPGLFLSDGMRVITTGSRTPMLWDLPALIRANPSPDATDAELWADVAHPNPAVAYRAGVELMDRGRLIERAVSLPPLPPRAIPAPDATSQWREWLGELSSPDAKTRERAHKSLEAAGPAAATEIQRALARKPGGETEVRLSSLVRLIEGTETDNAAADRAAFASPDLRRARRVVELLRWSDTPQARIARDHLTGEDIRDPAPQNTP